MSNQKWADAATENCVWLLQTRHFPAGLYQEVDEDFAGDYEENEDGNKFALGDYHDEDCWSTESVFLNRLEAFEAGARRVYNYGQYGKSWRIYGVPARGEMVTLLANAGVNQEMIDEKVKEYDKERPEWEKVDSRVKDIRFNRD